MMNISDGNNNILQFNLKRLFKIMLILLPLAFAGNIIYTLLSSEMDIFPELLEFKIIYLSLAALLCIIPWFSHLTRIVIWSRVFKKPVTAKQAFKAILASDIGAAATPTMMGGGYAKAGYLISYGFTAGEATIITIMGTIEDGVFFLFALPAALVWSRAWDNPHVQQAGAKLISNWPLVIIAAVLIVSLIILLTKNGLFRKRDADKSPSIEKMKIRHGILSSLRKYKNDLILATRFVASRGKAAFLLTVTAAGIGWCCRYGAISALVFGLGLEADPVLFFLMQWVVFTTMTMIPTPGAIGGAEVSFMLIYNGPIPSFAIPIVTSAWRFITFYLPLGLGSLMLSFLEGTDFRKKKEATIVEKKDIKPAVYVESTGK